MKHLNLIKIPYFQFSYDYYKTLSAWGEKFDQIRPQFEDEYGAKYCRIWKTYLVCGAAGFYTRKWQLFQIVLSKNGIEGGYRAPR